MEEYDKLLEKCYKNVKKIDTSERFEIPKAAGHIEGNKTIIANFGQIVSLIRRAPEHFSKFLARELAAQPTLEKERLIFNRKIPSAKINEKVKEYAEEFVICPQCKKPDTELIKEKGFVFIHCLACGAKHSVRAKIH
ncbi:MAG: translation initiation factor IF-2 subunit beta [archaeon]